MTPWLTHREALWQLAGWTMLHYLWLGTIIALAGALLRLACRRTSPNIRYAISLFTLTALAAAPAAIAAWLTLHSPAILAGSQPATQVNAHNTNTPSQNGSAIYHPPRIIDLAHEPPTSQQTFPLPSPGRRWDQTSTGDAKLPERSAVGRRDSDLGGEVESATTNATITLSAPDSSIQKALTKSSPLDPSLPLPPSAFRLPLVVPYLPYLWLTGAPLTFTLLAAGLLGSNRLRCNCLPITSGPAFEIYHSLASSLRLTRRTTIAACNRLAQPLLIGILRPLILLPAAALATWTPEELEMVLLHELAHVRRWDNLVNLLQRLVESVLFFHPAVWLASRQVRHDREDCCDALVVAHTNQPETYATLLIAIASARRSSGRLRLSAFFKDPTFASAMANQALATRIRRILQLPEEPMRITRQTLAAVLLLPALLFAGALYTAADENPPPSKVEEGPGRRGARGGTNAETSDPDKTSPHGAALEPTKDTAVSRAFTTTAPQGLPEAQHARIIKLLKDQGYNAALQEMVVDGQRRWMLTITGLKSSSPHIVWEEDNHGLRPRVIDGPSAPTPGTPVLQQQIYPEQQSPRQSVVKLFTPGATYREVKRALDELHAEGYDVKIDQLPDGSTKIIGSPKRAPTSSAHEPGPMQDAASRRKKAGDNLEKSKTELAEAKNRLAVLEKIEAERNAQEPGPAAAPAKPSNIIAQFPPSTDPSIIEAITRQLDQQGRKYVIQHDPQGSTTIVNQLPSDNKGPASENTSSAAVDASKLSELLSQLDSAREAVVTARKHLSDVVAKWKNAADAPLTTDLSALVVSGACDSDPNYLLYNQQIALIERQLKQRQADAANLNDPDIQRLQAALQATKEQATAYRTQLEASARQELTNSPNEARQFVLAESSRQMNRTATDLRAAEERFRGRLAEFQSLYSKPSTEPKSAPTSEAAATDSKPLASPHTASNGPALTTAFLKIQPVAKQGEPLSPQELQALYTNQLTLIKSPAVIKQALASLTDKAWAGFKQSPGAEALVQPFLDASFPGDGEIMELKLHQLFSPDLDEALLKAIIAAYKKTAETASDNPDSKQHGSFKVDIIQQPTSDLRLVDHHTAGTPDLAPPAVPGQGPTLPPGSPLPIPPSATPSSLVPNNPAAPEFNPAPGAIAPYTPADAAPTYLYDGKPFAYWRDLWKHELSTDRRIQAIEALSAFSRADAGRAREAAQAILDVAIHYDFDSQEASKLRTAVINAFADSPRPAIPPQLWLPALLDGLHRSDDANSERWKSLLQNLIPHIQQPDAKVRELLYRIARNESLGTALQAIRVLVAYDKAMDEPDVEKFIHAAFKDPKLRWLALEWLGFRRLDKAPEQLAFLFDADSSIQLRARKYLSRSMPRPEIVEALLKVLTDPKRADDHTAAIRALSACRGNLNVRANVEHRMAEEYRKVLEQLANVITQGPAELLAPAIAAYVAIASNPPFGAEKQLDPPVEPRLIRAIENGQNVDKEREGLIAQALKKVPEEFDQILPSHADAESAE